MRQNENLTHTERLEGMSMCFRELVATEISNRNMPNIINRSKAVAAVVTAIHREEIMEAKKQAALKALEIREKHALIGKKKVD